MKRRDGDQALAAAGMATGLADCKRRIYVTLTENDVLHLRHAGAEITVTSQGEALHFAGKDRA